MRWYLLAFVCLLASACAPKPATPPAMPTPTDHQVYVWQRLWTPAVSAAIEAAPSNITGFRLLVVEATAPSGWQPVRFSSPGISAPSTRLRRPVAVVRVSGQRGIEETEVQQHLFAWVAVQRTDGWAGLEVDYDCPTSRLPEYTAVLSRLRRQLPAGWQLSITALPAWIGSPALPALLTTVDSSVLQVHSVMRPQLGLFQAGLAVRWANEYARVAPHPFRIALPNYGSRVAWTDDGVVTEVVSEDNAPLQPGSTELMSQPTEVARVLAELQRRPPPRLAGYVWFRLPVAGDRRIWGVDTWTAVMKGNPVQPRFEVRTEPNENGATWLALRNTGNADGAFSGALLQPTTCLAVDAVRPFALHRGANEVRWRASGSVSLPAGKQVYVGWTRCNPGKDTVTLAP